MLLNPQATCIKEISAGNHHNTCSCLAFYTDHHITRHITYHYCIFSSTCTPKCVKNKTQLKALTMLHISLSPSRNISDAPSATYYLRRVDNMMINVRTHSYFRVMAVISSSSS